MKPAYLPRRYSVNITMDNSAVVSFQDAQNSSLGDDQRTLLDLIDFLMKKETLVLAGPDGTGIAVVTSKISNIEVISIE